MTNRKLIRPDLGDARKGEGPRTVRRKSSPPEQTNAEEFYYLKQMQARTPIVLTLVNGDELRGWIEWYDKGAIKFNRPNAPNLLIPKTSILYLFKEEELRRSNRRKPAAAMVPGQAGPRPLDLADAALDGDGSGGDGNGADGNGADGAGGDESEA